MATEGGRLVDSGSEIVVDQDEWLRRQRDLDEAVDRAALDPEEMRGALTAAGNWQDSVPSPNHRIDELEAAFVELWAKVRRDVAGRLRERARPVALTAAAGGSEVFTVTTAGLFDRETWGALFEEIAADAVADQVVAGATDAAVAGDVSETSLRAAVLEHIEAVRALGVHLDASVGEVLTDAMAERLTLNETVMRLREHSGLSEASARATARTEAVAAANAGLDSVWVSDPAIVSKAWEAIDDHRTRPAHHAADGQVVDVRSSFTVGGFPARYPGDPRLPVGERILCRCRIVPIERTGGRTSRSLADATFQVLRRIASALGIGRGQGDRDTLAARVRAARRGEGLSVDRMSFRQLHEQARAAGIKGRWRMSSRELIAALLATRPAKLP